MSRAARHSGPLAAAPGAGLRPDPASAWVSANAGSGKTHVLTQRVLRLLLAGAKPAQILGLTFTKAAAANMAGRIFDELAEWTSLDDETLAEAIVETGAGRPGPPALAFARQLFARTIETPGGLKIQTLHAFCERLLQLFPFEANVPAHFKVVDEREAAALMTEARDRAIAALKASSEGEAALDRVARDAGAFDFDTLLAEAKAFAETFAAFDDRGRVPRGAAAPARPPDGETTASVEAEMLGGDIGRSVAERWAQALAIGKAQATRRSRAKLVAADAETWIGRSGSQALLDAFFTKDGEGEAPRRREGPSRPPGAARQAARPRSGPAARARPPRCACASAAARPQTLERSVALFAVAGAILESLRRGQGRARRARLRRPDRPRAGARRPGRAPPG